MFQRFDTPLVAYKIALVALYRLPLFLWWIVYGIHRDTSFLIISTSAHLCARGVGSAKHSLRYGARSAHKKREVHFWPLSPMFEKSDKWIIVV